MPEWNYGDAYKRHPIAENEIAVFENGGMVKVHDIFNPLPAFMAKADLIFTDPPWSQGNMTSFYTKADQDNYHRYGDFVRRLFECVGKISPVACYLEVGKDSLSDFIQNMKKLYPHVTFFNSTYYRKKENLCYVVRGGRKGGWTKLDGKDEEDIIAWICQNEDYGCIGDLCIGRGLVAKYAHRRQFVGTELNHKRLSVLLENMTEAGLGYLKIKESEYVILNRR